MGVLATTVWSDYLKRVRLVQGIPYSSTLALVRDSLMRQLATSDVRNLVDLSRHSKIAYEKAAAADILGHLYRAKDPRFAPILRQWAEGVRRKAHRRMLQRRRELQSLDPHGLSAQGLKDYFGDFRLLDPEERERRLLGLARGRSRVAQGARHQLEMMGVVSRQRIAAMGRRWRTRRDRNTLNWLYDCCITRVGVGASVQTIVELLGRPNVTYGRHEFRWNSREPRGRGSVQLVVFADRDGGLESWKIK